MLRCDQQIRLTRSELERFRVETGVLRPPRTIAEYNEALQAAADRWRNDRDCAHGEFVAELIEGEKLPGPEADGFAFLDRGQGS